MSNEIKVFCEDSSHEGRRCQVATLWPFGGMREDFELAIDGMGWDLEPGDETAAERRRSAARSREFELKHGHRLRLADLADPANLAFLERTPEDPEHVARNARKLLGRSTGSVVIDPAGNALHYADFPSGSLKGWHLKWVLVCKLCGYNVQMRALPMFPILDTLEAAGQEEITLTFLEQAKMRAIG